MNSLAKAFGGAGYAAPQQQTIGGAAPDAGAIVAEISGELDRLGLGGDIDKALTALDSAKGLNETHVQQYNALPDQEKANFWRSLTGEAGGDRQMPGEAPQPAGRMESPYGAGNLGAPVGGVQTDEDAEFLRGYETPGPGMQMQAPSQGAGFQGVPQMPPMGQGPARGDEPFDPNMMPGMGEDPRGMFGQEDAFNIPQPQGNSFIPGAEYQTADMAGINLDLSKGGAPIQRKAQEMAFAYRSLVDNVDNYKDLIAQYGGRFLPGEARQKIDTAHAAILMQLKDIYAMGAPQAADIEMLERLIYNPNGAWTNAREELGADIKGEANAGLDQALLAVTNMVKPYMDAGDIDMNELTPKRNPTDMSDDDLRKALGL